jgi:hypothetical protein
MDPPAIVADHPILIRQYDPAPASQGQKSPVTVLA